ncbi:hypothetical protein M758_UG281300 [Ceratodon purpureus]|nr:hypothetical protein M758_UG281300 [Ceratodon purpureus]
MKKVWDGNHRLQAWMPIIEHEHIGDIEWHYSVESVILEPKGNIPSNLTALHEVNWRNQKSHVATNLVHRLYQIQNIAPQPLAYFEGLVSKALLNMSKAKQVGNHCTWYTLTLKALNFVLYQQELGEQLH